MVFGLSKSVIALILLTGCATADPHSYSKAQEGKASLRMVVNPAPDELYSLVLSGDGKTVAGSVLGTHEVRAFIWTEAGGRQDLPTPASGSFVHVAGLSHDGSSAAGYGELPGKLREETNAFLWEAGKGTRALGHLQENPDINHTEALAISADGKVVAGTSRIPNGRRPFLWTQATGMQVLDAELPHDSHPVALSGDGTVVTGGLAEGGVHRVFRWSRTEGVELLGDVGDIAGGGNIAGFPSAISRDGRVIVGAHGTAGADGRGAQHAFRWTAEEGIVDLGALPGRVDNSGATAVNADGTVIVGSSGSGVRAFVWDAAHGMRAVEDVLQAAGVETGNWRLTRAVGVSDDGTRILCYGYSRTASYGAEEVALLVTLPAGVYEKDTP